MRAAALHAATIESSVAAEKANSRAEGCDMQIQVLCICSSRALILGTLRINVLLKQDCDCP